MCRIRMLIHASVKQRRRILANRALDQRPPAWMFCHKRTHIVNHAGDSNERGSILGAPSTEIVPVDDRELGE
jgi:hypothetical protein